MRVILGLGSHKVDDLLRSLLDTAEEGSSATIVDFHDGERPPTVTRKSTASIRAEMAITDPILNLTEDGVRKLYEEIGECSIIMQVIFLVAFEEICYLRLSDGQYMSPVVTVFLGPEFKKLGVGAVIEVKETQLEASSSHKKRSSEKGSFLRDPSLSQLVITNYSVVAERHNVRRLLGSLDTSLSYKAALSHIVPILKKRNPQFRFTEKSLKDKMKAAKIFKQGTIYFGMKKLEKAIAAYETAKSLYPYDHRFWYNTGRVLFEMDLFESAEEEFFGALKMNPFEMKVYAATGYAAMKQKHLEKAMEYSFNGHFICGESEEYFNIMCEAQRQIGEKEGEGEDYDFRSEAVSKFVSSVYGDEAHLDRNLSAFAEARERQKRFNREIEAMIREEEEYKMEKEMAEGDCGDQEKDAEEESRMPEATLEISKRSRNLYHETLKDARRSYETKVFRQALERFGKVLAYASPNGDSTAVNGYSGCRELQELQFLIAACKIHANIKVLEGMSTMNFFLGDDNALEAYASAHYFLGLGYKRMCIGKLMLRESSNCSESLRYYRQETFKWPESDDIFPESDPEQLKILNEELYNGGEYQFDQSKSVEAWLNLPIDHRIPAQMGDLSGFEALLEYVEKLVEDTVKELRQQGNLIGRPSEIKPTPRATCRFENCTPGKEKIYETNPDFKGFVDILCEDLCLFTYHPSCWEAFKTLQGFTGSNSDKNLLGSKCFAPDCPGKINGILIHDETSTLRQEVVANTGGKQNSASGAKHKKKKKKKKSKQTKPQAVKDTGDSECENISEEVAHIEETATNSGDADGDKSQCSNDYQNNAEEKAQGPVSDLPIDPEISDQASVVIKPSIQEDLLTLMNSKKKKKIKKPREATELDLGSPLDTDESNQSESAARLRLLKEQKEAQESDEKNVPKSTGSVFPQVRPLDRSQLLDPENPFYMPQHLRDNPEELEKVLQTKKIASSSSSFENSTNTTLPNDGKKGKKSSHHLDDTKDSCSSAATSLHVNSGVSSCSSQKATNPTKSTVKQHQVKSVTVGSNSYSTRAKTRDRLVKRDSQRDSHSEGLPKDLLEKVRAKNEAAIKRFLSQRSIGLNDSKDPSPSAVESTPENVHESQSSDHLKDENKREERSEDNTGRDPSDKHEVEEPGQNLVEQRADSGSPDTVTLNSQSGHDDEHEVEEPKQKSDIQKDADGITDNIAVNSQNCDDDTHNVEEPRQKSVVQKDVDSSVDIIFINSQSGDDDTREVEEPRQNSAVQKAVDGSVDTIAVNSRSGGDDTKKVEELGQKLNVQKDVDGGPNTAASTTQNGLDDIHKVEEPRQKLVVQKAADGCPNTIATNIQSGLDEDHKVEETKHESVVQETVDGTPNTNAISSQSGHDGDHTVEESRQKLVGLKAVDGGVDTVAIDSESGDDDDHKVEGPRHELVAQKDIDGGPNTLAINTLTHEIKTSREQNKCEIHKDLPSQSHQILTDQYSKEDEIEEENSGAEEESEETGPVKDSMEMLIEENQKLKDEMIQIESKKDLEIRFLKQNMEKETAEKRELKSEKESLAATRERELKKFKAEMSQMQEEVKKFQNRQKSLERKYERSIHRIDELDVKLVNEQKFSSLLGEEVKSLQESLSSTSRRACEAEVKYLCVKRDLAESFLNRTIDRLTSEVVHLEKLQQHASEDSIPDLATISRTVKEWDDHIRSLQGQRSQFLEEANHLISLVSQGQPLNAVPQQDLVIPAIPNINIAPLFTIAPNPKKQLVQPCGLESRTVPVTLAGPSAYGGGAIPKGTIASNPKQIVMTEAGSGAAYKYPDTHKLFVGKIPREFTELDIQRAFSDLFGEVVGVTLYDKGITPKGKPIPKYGFVTFYNADDQEKALKYGSLMIGDCELKIQAKKPRYPANTWNLAVEGPSSDGSRYERNKSVECTPRNSAKPNIPLVVSDNPVCISGASPSKLVWSQPGKPANGKGGVQSVAVTTTSGNDDIAAYKRLIEICKQHMGKEYSSPEICSALREVRMRTSNNFSEMSVDHIVESVKQHLRARKLVAP